MLSQDQSLAKQAETWDYMKIWVDPILFPLKIVMVIGDRDGSCRIFNPTYG